MNADATRILVADDESSVRWVLAKALEEDGYEIVQAESGSEALQCLKSRRSTLRSST